MIYAQANPCIDSILFLSGSDDWQKARKISFCREGPFADARPRAYVESARPFLAPGGPTSCRKMPRRIYNFCED